MLPGAVAAATAAAIAAAKAEAEAAEESLPADDDGPSLSVSVIFEPDVLPAIEAAMGDGAPSSAGAASDSPHTPAVLHDRRRAPRSRSSEGTDSADPLRPPPRLRAVGDFFFDEDFANMPMALPDGADGRHDAPRSRAGLRRAPDDRRQRPSSRRVSRAGGRELRRTASSPCPAAGRRRRRFRHADPDPEVARRTCRRRRRCRPPRARGGTARARTTHARALPSRRPWSRRMTRARGAHADAEATCRCRRSRAPGCGGRKKKSTHGQSGKSTADRARRRRSGSRRVIPRTASRTRRGPAHLQTQAAAEARARAESTTDEIDPWIGRKIADGKYTIDSAIGSGAAGAVYKATHRELRRTVAIKVLHPHYQKDPHFMKSFRGEALAASQLDHPNVMRVLDFGQEPDGLVYIVMEFLSGRTLQSLLDEERRLQPDRAVEIMIQVCAALSVAHDNGIIHRDIKPDNIMLVPSRNDEGGTFELVKVCDFGIAALQNPTREDAELGLDDDVDRRHARVHVARAGARQRDRRALRRLRLRHLPLRARHRPAAVPRRERRRDPDQAARRAAAAAVAARSRGSTRSSRRSSSARSRRSRRSGSSRRASCASSSRSHRPRATAAARPTRTSAASSRTSPSSTTRRRASPGSSSRSRAPFSASAASSAGIPRPSQAMKELLKSTKAALRGRRRADVRASRLGEGGRLLRDDGTRRDRRPAAPPRLAALRQLRLSVHRGASRRRASRRSPCARASPTSSSQYIIEMLLGPHAHEDLRKELAEQAAPERLGALRRRRPRPRPQALVEGRPLRGAARARPARAVATCAASA